MSTAVRIPPMNPIRFIPYGDRLPQEYNTFGFYRGFNHQQFRGYQTKTEYMRKVAGFDPVNLYIDTVAPEIRAVVIDVNENEVYEIFYGGGDSLATNTVGDTTEYYTTYYTNPFVFNELGVPDGVYFIKIYCDFDGFSKSIISEPLLVKAAGFEGTQLITYTHDENDYDVRFTDLNVVFNMRIESDLLDPEPNNRDVAFLDMGFEVNILEDSSYNTQEWVIGTGVPAYIIDTAKEALKCSNFNIDGNKYVKDQNATFNSIKANDSRARGLTIKLQAAKSNAGYAPFEYNLGNVIDLLTLNVDGSGDIIYPLAWTRLAMIKNDNTRTVDTGAAIIDSPSAMAAYLDYLNNVYAPANALYGEFFLDGNKIKYNNASFEIWIAWTAARMIAMSDRIGIKYFSYSIPGVPILINISLTGITGSTGFDYVYRKKPDGIAHAGRTSDISDSYAPFETTHKIVEIFHTGADVDPDKAIGGIQIPYSGFANATCYNFETYSVAPYALEQLIVQGAFGYISEAVDTTLIKYCNTTLAVLILDSPEGSSSGETLFAQDVFNLGVIFGTQLVVISITGYLDVTGLNNAILQYRANSGLAMGGIMDVRQYIPAVATGLADAVLVDLATVEGWTVLRD